MNTYNFSFFWEGKIIEDVFYTKDFPSDEAHASGLVYGAIKLWFENQNRKIPKFVRNVKIDDGEVFHWSIMPLRQNPGL